MKTKLYVWVGLFMLMISSNLMAEDFNRNAILFNAMSPYEDLTEYALDQDKTGAEETIGSLDELVATLKDILPQKTLQILNDNIHKMETSKKDNNFPRIALLAVDSYKVISENLDASELEVPREVVILDYVGFKIHALLKQHRIDWDLI